MTPIFNTVITFVVSGILGYCVSIIKEYKVKIANRGANERKQNIAIRAILKSQLTKTYFVYSSLKKIPDYVYQDFLDMLEVYEDFDGDGFVHTLAHKMENWEIVKTDIM